MFAAQTIRPAATMKPMGNGTITTGLTVLCRVGGVYTSWIVFPPHSVVIQITQSTESNIRHMMTSQTQT